MKIALTSKHHSEFAYEFASTQTTSDHVATTGLDDKGKRDIVNYFCNVIYFICLTEF